jgi:hypothetical protein
MLREHSMRRFSYPLVLKIAAAVVPFALVVLAMALVLPAVKGCRERQVLGEGYVFAEAGRIRIAVPREAGEPLAKAVASDFEKFTTALYKEYGEPLGLRPVRDTITIRVFASHADLVKFAAREMRQDASHVGGFYDPASWSIALTLLPPRDLLLMLFHEATHLVMDRSAEAGEPQWSVWLSEGLAVYFEQTSVQGGRLRLGGASRRDARLVLAYAARRAHVPLRTLVRGGRELFRGPLGSLCYREAGLLVAFLLDGAGGRHRQAFFRYCDLERRPGPCPPTALEQYLGTSLDALENDWLAYLQGIAQ